MQACRLAIFALLVGASGVTHAQQNPAHLERPHSARISDRFTPLLPGQAHFTGGLLGTRYDANWRNRLLKVDEQELLDGFEKRPVPHQDWAGEHVGKWLHAACLTFAETGDPILKAKIERVVARLVKTQEPDGYLGTYMPEHRWTSWDVWVHKYNLIGLLAYYQISGSKVALDTCRKMGDLLVRTFGFGPGKRDINRAGEHMGMAADSVMEPVVLLYRATGDERYLAFARYIVANYDTAGGPAILATLERTHSVKRVANAKAYEMTSNFNGLLELYRTTGDSKLLKDMQIAWDDISRNRIYLTGSASSYEVFQEDNQFPNSNKSNICETCVTVTWEQMNLQLLRLTGQAACAEELERLVYNHLFAAQRTRDGAWVYYTPLEGRKQYDLVTTCCHSSGPRGVALLPEFAVMTSNDGGLVLNLYNNLNAAVELPRAGKTRLTEQTEYPLDGAVKLTVSPAHGGVRFPIYLRIPAWSTGQGSYSINNGKSVPLHPTSQGYATLSAPWKSGDSITLHFPVSPRLVIGKNADEGKAAVMLGPVALALDASLNPGIGPIRAVALASDNPAALAFRKENRTTADGAPIYSVAGTAGPTGSATRLYLTPFADAGVDGKSQFTVWIARPGHAAQVRSLAVESLFYGCTNLASRDGNQDGDIADDDPASFRVTFNSTRRNEDWFAVRQTHPVTIDRVVYMHGRSFHDGGWFDTSEGKPRIEAQLKPYGVWVPLGVLTSYPATTATSNAGLTGGESFELRIAPTSVVAIRVVGKPSCGDNAAQNFASCAELQAFATVNKKL